MILQTLDNGPPVMKVLAWPMVELTSAVPLIQAAVVLAREGGFLLAVPGLALSDELLAQASHPQEGFPDALVGPTTKVLVRLLDLDQEYEEIAIQEDPVEVLLLDMDSAQADSLVMDFTPEVPAHMNAVPFLEGLHHAVPVPNEIVEQARLWIASQTEDRLGFYSAQEELVPETPGRHHSALPGISPKEKPGGTRKPPGPKKATVASLSSQVESLLGVIPALTQQLETMAVRQEAMERNLLQRPPPLTPVGQGPPSRAATPVSAVLGQQLTVPLLPSFAKEIGPPPKTRGASAAPTSYLRKMPEDEPLDFQADVDGIPLGSDQGQHPFAEAILQQSKALVSLVNHLSSASSDPLTELTGSSSGVGVKGAAGRERLQRELAQQNGQFFLKVCQAIHRRQSPTTAPPESLDNLGGVSLMTYLERYGGYGSQRELGLIMWSLAHIFDAARDNNMGAVRDHTALLAVMIEQANMDANQWGVAWMLGLLEDPPHSLWMNRGSSATGAKKAFAPMCAQQWATTALAVLKEQEVLSSKRAEAASPKKSGNPDAQPDAKAKTRPRPKRRGNNQEPQGQNAETS